MPDYDGYLTFEDGQVSLGGQVIDGILRECRVGGSVRFDESEQDGLSGVVKTPMGWEDADISVTLELITDESSTCYERLSSLNSIFKGADNGINPRIYDVTNRHLLARGVNQVVFSGLESTETDADDMVVATLTFTEHNPPIQIAEKRTVASDTATTSSSSGYKAPSTTRKNPPASDKIMVDVS